MMATVTQAVGHRTVGVLLEPLDVLFFRDGRPFGTASHAASLAGPMPQTFAGAVWSFLLRQYACDFERLRVLVSQQRKTISEALDAMGLPSWIHRVGVRGPWLARASTDGGDSAFDVLLPMPAILKTVKEGQAAVDGAGDDLVRLGPLPEHVTLPGWQTTLGSRRGLRPLWTSTRAATEPATGFLTAEGMRALLRGDSVSRTQCIPWDALLAWDHRTGIAIEPSSLSAAESLIYAARFLALRRDVHRQTVFYAEVVLPDDAPAGVLDSAETLPFGGEGRRVTVSRLPQPFAWHTLEPDDALRSAAKPLVVLTTPGLFNVPWCPALVRDRLVAAAVGGGLAVSGWDLARGGPKPNRTAAVPGSVYFLKQPIASPPDSLADQPLDRQQGWGCYLTGVWNDE